ncbi:UPF0415 protein C7orf25 homolog [Hydra vulgaris]|uniref:UPF0415 protein C7orf25 homolog n=1 Tax=Hydra vulgaris TaxID=6087 RepID=A0ABM4BK71_HYDVU
MEQKLMSLISEAEDLLNRCKLMSHIVGASKLERKISAELKGLLSLKNVKDKVTLEHHLISTNITNLRAVVKAIENSPDVVSILQSFSYENDTEIISDVVVDAVVTGGYKWIKIIARKPLAVHRIWKGEGNFGDKDPIALSKEFILAAEQNPIHYESPSICFVFPRGITKSVHESLLGTGVTPIGKILPDPDFDNINEWMKLEAESNLEHITNLLSDFTARCMKVNLDITSLIVLTSNITNGECNYTFREEVLSKQAAEERSEPALPLLLEFINDKELYCCRTAFDNFQQILNTVGGPEEKKRSEILFKKVTVVEDNPAFYAMSLEESASVKNRSKVIFGTGETLQAITTTANTAFVRAAANQGVKFSSFFHASRALTEQKQMYARKH